MKILYYFNYQEDYRMSMDFYSNLLFNYRKTNKKSKFPPGRIIEKFDNCVIISTVDYDLIIYFDFYDKIWEYCKTDNYEYLSNIL